MDDKKKLLVEILNDLFKIMPSIKYGEFNKVFPAGEKLNALAELENKHPELHLARWNTKDSGISIVSIIATITHVLCDGDVLALNVDKDTSDDSSNYESFNDSKITVFTFLGTVSPQEEK